jgi:hypothetical protein
MVYIFFSNDVVLKVEKLHTKYLFTKMMNCVSCYIMFISDIVCLGLCCLVVVHT